MKKTSKITVLLLILCFVISLLPCEVSAEVTVDPGTIEGWISEGGGEISVVLDEVGKFLKPVMKLTRSSGDDESKIVYDLGVLSEGVYELELNAKISGDYDTAIFGIEGDISGTISGDIDEYTTVTTDVTVTDAQSSQSVILLFQGSGDAECYINEVIFRKKTINTVYSDNMVENYNFSKKVQSYDGWTTGSGDILTMITDNVDGVEQPVLEWTYNSKSGSLLSYTVGQLPVGFYELSAYVKSPNNTGEGRMGLDNDSNGGFPTNSPMQVLPSWSNEYTTVSRIVEINETNSSHNNIVRFYTAWGSAPGALYLANVSLKKIEYSEDGLNYICVGDNYIVNSDFQIYDTEGVITGWSTNVDKDYEVTTSLEGWSCSSTDTINVETMNVNGVDKPVLNWHFVGNDGRLLQYEIGNIPVGYYEISGAFYSTRNPGNGKVGLYNDAAGGFPDNSPKGTIYRNTGFEKFSRIVEINESASKKDNKLMFFSAWGSSEGNIYITDVSMRRIQYEDDGESYNYIGDNIIENGKFVQIKEIETSEENNVLTTEFKEFDREKRNILHWNFNNLTEIKTNDRMLRCELGNLEAGKYEVSVVLSVPGNPGETKFGIGSMHELDYPLGDINVNRSEFVTYTGVLETVNNLNNKYIIIQTSGEWTDGSMEISSVSLRKIDKVPFYGTNLIKNTDFSTDIGPSLDYWTVSGGYGYELYQKNFNGEIKNVLEVTYKQTEPTTITAKTSSLTAGTYEISANVCSPNNPGRRGFGVASDINGSFPDNAKEIPSEEKLPMHNAEWTTVTRKVTITENVTDSYVGFYAIWGTEGGVLYISDVSMRKVEDDGSYGDNLVLNPDFTVVEPEYVNVLSEEIKNPVEDYLKFDCDIYFDGEMHSFVGIDVGNDDVSENVFSVASNDMPMFNITGLDSKIDAGWYHVSAKLEKDRMLATITVTTPSGNIVQRAHTGFFSELDSMSVIMVKTTQKYENEEDIVKNLKVNYSDRSDLPMYLSPLNFSFYQDDVEIADYDAVPVNTDEFTVNLVSPILDEETVKNSIYITESGSGEKLEKASEEYFGGVYKMLLSEELQPNQLYTVHVDKTLSATSGDTLGKDVDFEFKTERAVTAEITGLTFASNQVTELSQVKSGGTAYMQLKYVNGKATQQSFTVMAIYYGKNQQLKNMQILKNDTITEGTESKTRLYTFKFGDMTDVEEIRFVVWDSLNTMNPLSTVYTLR